MNAIQPAREESVRHRLQIELSPEAHARLQEIRKKADATSNTELVRNSLRLYEWFLDCRSEGFGIQVVKDDLVRDVEIVF